MARKELLEAVLTKFAKFVIQQARTNLTKGRHNFDKTLYNSLQYKLFVGENSFTLGIEMEDYGDFQDKGVRGAGGTTQDHKCIQQAKQQGQDMEAESTQQSICLQGGQEASRICIQGLGREQGVKSFCGA
jgi:hypothetical protein